MCGMLYLMKSDDQTKIKIGHRTKSSVEEVRNEVNHEYGNDFKCFAVYVLGTHRQEDTEYLVKQIRLIVNMVAGTLKDTAPESYSIDPNKILSLLKAISILRGDCKNLIEM